MLSGKSTYIKSLKSIPPRERLLSEEDKLWSKGFSLLGGIDEVGRGALAGPVVACCVVFAPDIYIEGVDDSKLLTERERNRLFDKIIKNAASVGVGKVTNVGIDEKNIVRATSIAMKQAIEKCTVKPDFLLVDAMDLAECNIPQMALIKGDRRSHCIAAASIIAKVTRDEDMRKWSREYSTYGFDKHKGYGTELHIENIRKYGLSPIHRKSFCSKFVET